VPDLLFDSDRPEALATALFCGGIAGRSLVIPGLGRRFSVLTLPEANAFNARRERSWSRRH